MATLIDGDGPAQVEVVALNREAAQDLAARTAAAPRPAGCRTTLGPGQLCSVCWTDHTTGEAA